MGDEALDFIIHQADGLSTCFFLHAVGCLAGGRTCLHVNANGD